MQKQHFARIAITIPREDLATADRVARKLDRSRSWVIAESVRRHSNVLGRDSAAPAPTTRSHARLDQASGIGESRRAQLRADLLLTPEQRVRAAEDTARVSFVLRPNLGRRVISFDRYEDYLAWKDHEARGG